jgi:predicted nucleotidyltransferase
MDTEGLIRSLKEFDVEFLIIGATAFPAHGYVRSTLDIDIFIRPSKPNAEKTIKALEEFGYDLSEITVEDLLNKKILIRQYAVEADIHPFVKGITFTLVWKNKVETEFGKTKVYVASLDDLIKMKKAAGRPKDLEDLKNLQRLKDLKP